jgi:eukaryotic-like serine/threonine-protein kinase
MVHLAMECLACHTPNVDGARFCAKCGAPLPIQKGADADPLIGITIGGRYRIVGILGEGGMGRVYTAEQQMGTSVRKVAVKTLLSQFAKDPQTVARFMREVGTVSELEHPNTIKVYDFGQIEGSGDLYIAMELLQGISLDDVVNKGQPIPAERVDRILGQVCGSLQEAHDKGIVHRDLKPANIFLTTRAGEEDVVKVLDFGIAKRDSKDSKHEQKLTQQGTILGTPPYMSPEQFTGQELDARSDIYSLGVVAYEMLTGRLPFEADTPWQWMTQHMSAQPFPFETLPMGSHIPPKMRAAVMRALAKDKAQRPQTAREFFEDLTLGAARLSAIGLSAGGVSSMPTPAGFAQSPSTQAFPMTSHGGAPRAGSTQIGEPLIPDMAPQGSPRTLIGEPTPAPGTAPAGYPGAYQVAAPVAPQKKGGSGLLIGVIVAFLALGGGAAAFFVLSKKPAEDPEAIPLKTNTAKAEAEDKPSSTPATTTTASVSASPETSASAQVSASASSSVSAEPSASVSASTTTDPTPTTPTTPTTTTKKPQPGIDGCCSRYRRDATKFRLCSGMNARIKKGDVDRSQALGTLRGQGISCS